MRTRARANRDDPEVVAHVAQCPSCREMLTVAAWMQQLAALPVDTATSPDPTYLWWKAQILRQWDAERKATAPIDVGEALQVGVGVVGGALLLAWLWQQWQPLTASTAVPTSIAAVLLATAVILAMTAVFAARELFARE